MWHKAKSRKKTPLSCAKCSIIAGFKFSRVAAKPLKKLRRTNPEDSVTVRRRIKALLENPLPPQSVRLAGHDKEYTESKSAHTASSTALTAKLLCIGVVARRNKAYQQFATLVKSGTWPPAAE